MFYFLQKAVYFIILCFSVQIILMFFIQLAWKFYYQPGNKKVNWWQNFIFTKFLFLNDSCTSAGILTTLWAGIWHSQQKQIFLYHCIHTESGALQLPIQRALRTLSLMEIASITWSWTYLYLLLKFITEWAKPSLLHLYSKHGIYLA
jgi:hypothetical protein